MASKPSLTTGWRKSTYSGSGNNCIEVAVSSTGVAVRDSKDPQGPRLALTREQWRSFTAAVKAGDYGQG